MPFGTKALRKLEFRMEQVPSQNRLNEKINLRVSTPNTVEKMNTQSVLVHRTADNKDFTRLFRLTEWN